MDQDNHVYCTHCEQFEIVGDFTPHCEYENVCCIWNPEDSAPLKERPFYKESLLNKYMDLAAKLASTIQRLEREGVDLTQSDILNVRKLKTLLGHANPVSLEKGTGTLIKKEIIPCTIDEMRRAIKDGRKIVVYGDKVIYNPSSGEDPHKWYSKEITEANIAVGIGILD